MPHARSAGVLLYRCSAAGVEVLLVHPGGPYWARRDAGAWSVPKGQVEPGEAPRAAAWREFAEELGCPVPDGPVAELGAIRQRTGKEVVVWAVEGDVDADAIVSATFEIEWPPRSGKMRSFPEVDRAAWLDLDTARAKLLPAQLPLLDRLQAAIVDGPSRAG